MQLITQKIWTCWSLRIWLLGGTNRSIWLVKLSKFHVLFAQILYHFYVWCFVTWCFSFEKPKVIQKTNRSCVDSFIFWNKPEDCVPRTYPVLTGEDLSKCEAFSREFQSWDPWWISRMILFTFPILGRNRNEGISQSYNLGLPKLCNSGKGL